MVKRSFVGSPHGSAVPSELHAVVATALVEPCNHRQSAVVEIHIYDGRKIAVVVIQGEVIQFSFRVDLGQYTILVNVATKWVPTPTFDSIFRPPSHNSQSSLNKGRPKPTFLVVLVVKNGSTTFFTVSSSIPLPSSIISIVRRFFFRLLSLRSG